MYVVFIGQMLRNFLQTMLLKVTSCTTKDKYIKVTTLANKTNHYADSTLYRTCFFGNDVLCVNSAI